MLFLDKVCPVCDSKNSFVDFNGRKNAICTKCKSTERIRLIYIAIKDILLTSNKKLKIMHFAPEVEISKLFILRGDEYNAFDFVPSIYKSNFIKVEKFDICHDLAKVKDNFYDIIIHNHVLEHLPCSIEYVLCEFDRILKNGGIHLFTAPIRNNSITRENIDFLFSNEYRKNLFSQGDHLRIFGSNDFPLLLKDIWKQETILFDFSKYLNNFSKYALNIKDTKTATSNSVFYRYQPINHIVSEKIFNKALKFSGSCSTCGMFNDFLRNEKSPRESYKCIYCKSNYREREISRVLLELYSPKQYDTIVRFSDSFNNTNLKIYEPGIGGVLRKYFRSDNYISSDYCDNIESGSFHNKNLIQDLHRLSFESLSFDIVITQDIMEHTYDYKEAFSEIHRVLKVGGRHIFSIPVNMKLSESITRAKIVNNEHIYIQPKRYHGNGTGGKSLVYTDFGIDLETYLNNEYLSTEIYKDNLKLGIYTYVSTKLQE